MSEALSVLIVEDSESDTRLLVRELERASYDVFWERVETAGSMRSALKGRSWDLVIADHTMPNFSAPAALSLLQESGIDVPFLIVSGTVGEDLAVEAMRAGANDYLLKGNLKRLVPAIQRELEQAKQRRARRKAEESIRNLSVALEQAENAIFMTDPNGAINYVNPAFEKIYGYSKQEALGKTPRILKSGQHDQVYYERFWQRLLAGESIREEFVNKTRDGRLVTVETSVSPVLDARGNRVGFTAVQNDITERKLAEVALQESEKRFSLAFHASPVPTTITEHPSGRFLDVNDQFLRALGYSRQELIGHTSKELGIWKDRSEWERIASRLVEEGAVPSDESRLCTRSGEILDVIGSAVPIQVGSLTAVLATFLDITERKRAEKEIRKSEERFRRLFDSNTIGIAIADLSGGILETNDAYLHMLGYTREEHLAGRFRWDDLTPPEHRGRDQVAVEQLQRTGVAQPWEKELFRKDGSRVPVLIGVAMLEASEASCIAYIVDLSQQRQSGEALRHSEERYRLLFDSNPQPMWVFDEKTLAFLAVNDAACRHYGYTRDEFLGMTIREIRPAEEVPALLERLAEEGKTLQDAGVWRHRTKAGNVIEVEITSHPFLFDGRQAQLVLATDITARRQLEVQLRQAQKMEAIGQLAGGVAHDFNNLLTVILGYSDLLATEVGAKSPLMESIGEIRKSGERAASLTRQLLAFSRRQVLEPKVLEVNALVLDLEKMLRRLIGEDVELATVLDPGVGRVRADAGQIEQVIMNLAVNSRDAMPRGGKLTVETSNVELDEAYAREHVTVRPGSYVMLAVTDTGTGMGAETKSHIFEPFFTTKGQGKGTGLGLATVYGIVKQSGGYIWLYSELGRGTTFKVYLPRVDARAEEKAATAVKPSRGVTETILLVEDDQAVRALTRRLLEATGYKVIEASGAEEAIAIVKGAGHPIDLLLTDVVMPEMGGSVLASRLAALRPGIKVLYMSGYTDDAVVRHGLVAEGATFLQKPFTPEVLARKVAETLALERS